MGTVILPPPLPGISWTEWQAIAEELFSANGAVRGKDGRLVVGPGGPSCPHPPKVPIIATMGSFDDKLELVVHMRLTRRFRLRIWFMIRLIELACWIGSIGVRVEDEQPGDYVQRDVAAELREWVEYLSGVCADQLADSPFPDEIDELLDATKWLALDEEGVDRDGNERKAV